MNIKTLSYRNIVVGFWLTLMAAICAIHPQTAHADTVDTQAPWDWKDHVWGNINGKAYHFDRNAGYNEKNWGLGVQIETSPDTGWMIGRYYNSVRRSTYYVWRTWEPLHVGPVQMGLFYGLDTGYRSNPWAPEPIAALAATWKISEHTGVNFACLPTVVCVANAMFKFW